jgi:hypothetical protein
VKQFRFSLDQVLAWRRTQALMEERLLETLHTKLRGLAAGLEKITREYADGGRHLMAFGSATGLELARLDSFRRAAGAEMARLETARADCRRQIDEQTNVLAKRRRDVRLLERLKERRLDAWEAEYAREVERDAAEAHLARWLRR